MGQGDAIGYLAAWLPRLTSLASLAMGAMTGYWALRILACDDEGMMSQYKLRLKNCLTAAVVLVTISAILLFVATRFLNVPLSKIAFLS